MKTSDIFNENAEDLDIGDPVIITGNVQFKGKTGDIVDFGKDKRFVIVNLYNYGKHSFHSSDVSYNDYVESGDEQEYLSQFESKMMEAKSLQSKFEKHLARHGYDVGEKSKYWEKKLKDIDAQIAAWDAEMAARKQGKETTNEDGGEYYYEILAKKVFADNPNLSTKGRADDLFKAGWKYAVQDLGKKRAQWEFGYDEDFVSDFVSAYGHLQRGGELDEGWKQNLAALGTAAALGATGMAAMGGNTPTTGGPELANPNQIVQMIKAGKISDSHDLQAVLAKAKNKNQVWSVLQNAAGMQGSSDADAVVQTIAGVREGVSEDLGTMAGAAALGSLAAGAIGAGMGHWLKKDREKERAKMDAIVNPKKKSKGVAEGSEILKAGLPVRVPHKGKMVPGKIVRYDSGKGGYSPAYVVDIGEYESKLVPVYDVKQGVAEGEYDDPRWEPREPDMSRRVDWDIEAERNRPEESEPAKTVTVRDNDGNVVLQFPSTGGFYGDVRYAASKGIDTDSGEYHMSWKRDANEDACMSEGTGATSEQVASEIVRRIINRHKDAITAFGPEAIMAAAREVGEFFAGAEELGTSDISIATKYTLDKLDQMSRGALGESASAGGTSAGAIATTPGGGAGKNVGSLFGGTYKQKRTKKSPGTK